MEKTIVPKRPREEPQVKEPQDVIIDGEESSSKRHKPYNHILYLLESEELEEYSAQEDLSPLITTLEHEITCPSYDDSHDGHNSTLLMSKSQDNNNNVQHNNLFTTTTTSTLEDSSTSTTFATTHSSEDDKEREMRHLLEASDDELGIPNGGELQGSSSMEDFGEYGFTGSGDNMFSSICDDGLFWELEDETANVAV